MLEFFVVLPLNIDDDDKRDPFIFQWLSLTPDRDIDNPHNLQYILVPSVVHTELEQYVIVYFQMPLFFTNFNFRISPKHFIFWYRRGQSSVGYEHSHEWGCNDKGPRWVWGEGITLLGQLKIKYVHGINNRPIAKIRKRKRGILHVS